MLRHAFLGTLIASLLAAPCAQSESLANQEFLTIEARSLSTRTIDESTDDLYILCAFYPKPGTCESVYRQAMKDNSIAAQSVRAEYMNYARYLHGNAGLSESDRQYLKDNDVIVPRELSAANLAGLHNVINDQSLGASEKLSAVNSFLSRAVQAELYCGFNKCDDPRVQMSTTGI